MSRGIRLIKGIYILIIGIALLALGGCLPQGSIPVKPGWDFSGSGGEQVILEEQAPGLLAWQLPTPVGERFAFTLELAEEGYGQWQILSSTVEQELGQQVYTYSLAASKGGETIQAEVILRHLATGDITYFVRARADSANAGLVWQVLQLNKGNQGPEELWYLAYGEVADSRQAEIINNQISRWRQLDGTSLKPGGELELSFDAIFTNSLRFGLIDVFSFLEHGVIVEHPELMPQGTLAMTSEKLIWRAPLPLYPGGYSTEHWGMVAARQLVDFAAPEAEDVRIADLDRFRKLRPEGIYYQVPTTYYPYAPNSFWLVPAEHIGERFIRMLGQAKAEERQVASTYLENLVLMSINHSLRQQTEGGFWLTLPRSQWLYEDYGIEAGFYDTRFSTDAAIFLLRVYQEYGFPEVRAAIDSYAQFLNWFSQEYSFETANGGLLVQDYFHPSLPHEPTHVSLNHLVTEMNFLLMHHQATGAQEHLEIAARMRQAVHDTGHDWIKDNHDLWYAIMPDGTYGLQDYPRLTRNDLLLSLRLMQQVWGVEDQLFQELIDSKNRYLKETNQPLF